ncbi:MAG: membrane protein insertion efficiency factor YidD [Devosiaceae bacterium]|nr:membrane protein insertion efficiency factor YidD [Devosiaceae bacterium]
MSRFVQNFLKILDWPFKILAVILINIYRYTLSSIAGRTCRHLPSCSEFTRDAIWRYGFWPGGWIGLARFVRCRPGGTHGYDPVPEDISEDARWYFPWKYGRWK